MLSLIDIIRVFGEGTKALIGPNTTEHYLSSELLLVRSFSIEFDCAVTTTFRTVIGTPPLSAKGCLKMTSAKLILVHTI